jgi:SAM-dependent methyltransferase
MFWIEKVARKVSANNRKRKYRYFLELLKPLAQDKILDVGFSDKEYSKNDNYLEKYYPYKDMLTALGIEEPKEFLVRYPGVKALKYDGKIFPFKDKEFDIGWSNAVIEHVGKRQDQLLFIKELNRTCKKVFFTTPNYYFPIEIHTRVPLLHFMPKNIFDKILILIGKKWATGNYMNLLSLNEIKYLLESSGVKKYIIIKNHFLLSTLDFIIIIN